MNGRIAAYARRCGAAARGSRPRRARLALVVAAAAAIALSGAVVAHPLGNTSVAVYARVVPGAENVELRVVVDIAEIPALRIEEFVDANENGTIEDAEASAYLTGFWAYLEPDIRLVVDDKAQDLEVVHQELSFPPGEGGLMLARAVFDLVATPVLVGSDAVGAEVFLTPFASAPGWREIIVQAGPGATIIESSVPSEDVTDELTTYPPELLESPLQVTSATFTYRVGEPTATPSAASPSPPASPSPAASPPASPSPAASPEPPPGGVPPGAGPGDPLVGLLDQELTPTTALLGLAIALGLGALHAVSPGHGKTLVAAYLVGTRADIRKGVGLGLTVAVTHTAGVFVLGAAILLFTEFVVPEQTVGWLSVASGILVVALGAVLIWRSRALATSMVRPATGAGGSRPAAEPPHEHPHGHTHPHPHDHPHPHAPAPDLRRRDVAVLGIVGGLVPSGSALLLLLSAVALDQIPYGLGLISAFGVGMAGVMVAISTGIVLLRRTPVLGWERWRGARMRGLAAWLPTASGLVVVALGVWLTVDALRNVR